LILAGAFPSGRMRGDANRHSSGSFERMVVSIRGTAAEPSLREREKADADDCWNERPLFR
jgi:hypothetical protein